MSSEKITDTVRCARCREPAKIIYDEDARRATAWEQMTGFSNMIVETTEKRLCTKCGYEEVISVDVSSM